jgi:serine protease Do
VKQLVRRTAPAVLTGITALALGASLHLGNASAQASPPDPPRVAAAAPALDTAALVAKVKASVVNITVEQALRAPASAEGESPFDFFFREGPQMPQRRPHALGSGFIFDDKGHVLTNAHVVENADRVRVKLADERELDAKVKGRDERLDIAVLEIVGAKDLPYATLGSSSSLQVGEPVVAIGNPFGLGHTVTSGIVSAKGRAIGAGPYDDFLQTDASINPGNSGGPLFDARGQVVGMNTAIVPSGQGIGFAIPADEIREVLPQLVSTGHVERGRLGVQIQDVDAKLAEAMGLGTTRGALAADVENGGPGASAGLRSGDVITEVDKEKIAHARDLSRAVARHAPGSKVTLTVRRGSETVSLPVTLGKLGDEGAGKRTTKSEVPSVPGSLGLAVEDAQGGGALVRRVAPDSPAAGILRPGDVIVEANRNPVRTANDLRTRAREAPEGKPLLLKVQREGSTRYVAIDRK